MVTKNIFHRHRSYSRILTTRTTCQRLCRVALSGGKYIAPRRYATHFPVAYVLRITDRQQIHTRDNGREVQGGYLLQTYFIRTQHDKVFTGRLTRLTETGIAFTSHCEDINCYVSDKTTIVCRGIGLRFTSIYRNSL